VFERVQNAMRAKVRARQYVITIHAEEEMDADGLSIFDVENAVLTGSIVERQLDRAKGERKYLIRGHPLEGDDAVTVVAKMGPTGKVVILTVYSE
jgi:hypothetical protein